MGKQSGSDSNGGAVTATHQSCASHKPRACVWHAHAHPHTHTCTKHPATLQGAHRHTHTHRHTRPVKISVDLGPAGISPPHTPCALPTCHTDTPSSLTPPHLVEHAAEHLCGHDEAGRGRVDLHVTREQPHLKLAAEVTELLVADRLDGTGVHSPGGFCLSLGGRGEGGETECVGVREGGGAASLPFLRDTSEQVRRCITGEASCMFVLPPHAWLLPR